MRPAVSVEGVRVQSIQRVSPAWLRPVAFGVVLYLHLALLLGVPWPAGTNIAQPPPFEIQVIPGTEPARLLVPLASDPVVEVRPTNAVTVDVQPEEAQPLSHGQEIAELKPSEPALATNSPPGVLVSSEPQTAELRPLAAQPSTPAVQDARPTPEAPSAVGFAAPVDPPSQGPLPSAEQPVAESEPLEVRPPAAPVRVAQPAHETQSRERPALVINAPSQPPSSEQRVAKLQPLEVRPPAAQIEVAQPAHETQSREESALVINTPSQPPSSEQRVVELQPLEVRPPAAQIQVAQLAREAPSSEESALAINPPSRPLPSEQRVEKLAPLGVPQAAPPIGVGPSAHEAPVVQGSALAINPSSLPALPEPQVAELPQGGVLPATAPVRIGPPDREIPMPKSATVTSDSPAQGTVLSSQQPVAKLEPYSPTAAPPLQDEGPITAGRVGKIIRYVEQYDGGRCFFVAPVMVTETEAKLEGYGASARPFEALDAAFRHENGFEASIDVRLVTPAQCPAVAFLGKLRGARAPRLHIDGFNLGPGAALTGTVDRFDSRNVELLVATDAGTVENMSHLLKPGADAKAFAIGVQDFVRTSKGQPQLLIAVASPLRLDALRFDHPVSADQLFSAALSEAARTNQPLAAMARYFKIDSGR